MIAPYWITQIQIARISGRADHGAANRTDRGTQSGVTRRSADGGTTCRTQKRATGGPITRIGAATGNQQCRRKSYNQHMCAHGHLPFY
jgi:hypothetical protein